MTFEDLIEARDGVFRLVLARTGGLRLSGIHGVGVGSKIVEGRPSRTMAVRVYLPAKRALRHIVERDRVPSSIDGVPIDVVSSPPAFVMSGAVPPQQQPRDPLCCGLSIGRADTLYGTLAAFCRSTRVGDSGRILMLSNQHVLVRDNSQRGEPIFQPGKQDAENQHLALRQVGTLFRWHPVQPGSIENRVDAAVADLSGAFGHELTIPGDAGRVLGAAPATTNTTVVKFGRTTAMTEGVVTDLSCQMSVGLDPADHSKQALFIDQIRIDKREGHALFGDSGDSGSLVFEKGTGKAVGLYFAGPIDGSYGLANHLSAVTERLEIELLT
jgi:hypothetical protein